MKLNKDHIFYEIKLQTLEADRKSLLESAEIFEKNLKKKKKEKHYMIMIRENTKYLKINKLKV